MDKTYDATQFEQAIYRSWEERNIFKATLPTKKKPYSVILPPPNANGNLHAGHAMMMYGDILIRYHKIEGYEVLWLPGADHAGFETQYVFEKHLKKEGKSRFDYDRATLYQMIWDFVHMNRDNMENQLRRLGFALDWSKKQFTLDPRIIKTVHLTFKHLFDAGNIYRDNRLVNYCTKCGTGFSDLEVKHVEQTNPLYYMRYGPFVVATVRPETMFGDVAIAVHPQDKRYSQWIGHTVEVQSPHESMSLIVIADEAVDPAFGTGAVKVTPAHDFNDYAMAKRHNLPMKEVITQQGRITDIAGPFAGMKVKSARKAVVAKLKELGLLERIDETYTHNVSTCYKCGATLEPLLVAQWYLSIRPLAERVIKAVKDKEIAFVQKRYQTVGMQWLENFHDWNISRQVVWGIRIPAYYSAIKKEWMVYIDPPSEQEVKELQLTQDEDTFDTWFSSGQWPYATLKSIDEAEGLDSDTPQSYYGTFYPTSVMETAADILPWWVLRMWMLGYYETNKPQFKTVLFHSLVRDKHGQKMSKSKGNVIDLMEFVEKYGADALRAALTFGVQEGADVSLSEDKVRAMRNFTNKIWNIGRFIFIQQQQLNDKEELQTKEETQVHIDALISEYKKLEENYHKDMRAYRFSRAFDATYHFLWHRFADYYIEVLKQAVNDGDRTAFTYLRQTYLNIMALLHPFMPFVTEVVWRVFHGEDSSILPS